MPLRRVEVMDSFHRRLALVVLHLTSLIAAPVMHAQGPAAVPNASSAPPLEVVRRTADVTLDGVPSETAWATAVRLPLRMFQPTSNLDPRDSVDVRLLYDERALYVSARMFASPGTEPRSASLVRDRIGSSDVFRILIDGYRDQENAVVFVTTPSGNMIDYAVASDGRVSDNGWNAFWDVASVSNSSGWSTEMRIPWSSLRFQVSGDSVVLGAIAGRFTARTNEWDTWPVLPNQYANALDRPSIAQSLIVRGIRSERPRYIAPFAVGAFDRTPTRAAAGAPWRGRDSTGSQLGLDIRTNLTDNLSLDLTLNTDFAQVEVDDQQVNLSRFPLFFPEKRQFFLDRSGLFQLRTGGQEDQSQFFFSRRIGLSDDGRPLRMYGGGRAAGRIGGWDLGAMHLAVASPDSGGGVEQLSVARLRRRVLNPQSAVGLLATSRAGVDARKNLAVAADARLRVFTQDFITLQAAGAPDQQRRSDSASSLLQGALLHAEWTRPGNQGTAGVAYTVGATYTGATYAPGLGFLPRRNYTHTYANWRYGWLLPRRFPLRLVQPSVVATRFTSNADGKTESLFGALFLNFDTRTGWSGFLGSNYRQELLRVPLRLSATAIAPARLHAFSNGVVSISSPQSRGFGFTLFTGGGQFYDGTYVNVGAFPFWAPSQHFSLGAELNLNRLEFASRAQSVNTDLFRLRVNAALDRKLSLAAFLQQNVAARAIVPNVRLRYRFGEGRDLFLVYNERINTDLEPTTSTDVPLPRSAGRVFVLKYTFTFTQ
jgi:hypothetical protein